MGRKAINKDRKDDESRKIAWCKALFPHLQEHGLQRLSINKIAQYLAVSKSTLYEYFESKEEMIQLAVAQKIEEFLPTLRILECPEHSFEKRYWDFFDQITNKCRDISSRFLHDLQEIYPQEWLLVDRFLRLLMEEMGTFYQQGMQAGVFRKGSIPLLLEQDRHFIFSVMTNGPFLERHQLSLDQLIRDYLTFKFLGIKTNSSSAHGH